MTISPSVHKPERGTALTRAPRQRFGVQSPLHACDSLNYPCGPEPFLRDAEPGFALPL